MNVSSQLSITAASNVTLQVLLVATYLNINMASELASKVSPFHKKKKQTNIVF